MALKWAQFLIIPILFFASAAFAAPPGSADYPSEVNMSNVAKIQVGITTGEQVRALLGAPYRMNNYGDCNPVDYQEVWEYIGHDANGIFKIHIEFDEDHIARIVAKDSKNGPIEVLAIAPKPGSKHHH
jgi:outer membrane protein assembly factor BamE (lipoprotein component of BamABCDE complex)